MDSSLIDFYCFGFFLISGLMDLRGKPEALRPVTQPCSCLPIMRLHPESACMSSQYETAALIYF